MKSRPRDALETEECVGQTSADDANDLEVETVSI